MTKTIVSKKSKAGGIAIYYYKVHDGATETVTALYWHTARHVDQWNTVKINPHCFSQLILKQDPKNWRKGRFNN
jgi:hypothetical protein